MTFEVHFGTRLACQVQRYFEEGRHLESVWATQFNMSINKELENLRSKVVSEYQHNPPLLR